MMKPAIVRVFSGTICTDRILILQNIKRSKIKWLHIKCCQTILNALAFVDKFRFAAELKKVLIFCQSRKVFHKRAYSKHAVDVHDEAQNKIEYILDDERAADIVKKPEYMLQVDIYEATNVSVGKYAVLIQCGSQFCFCIFQEKTCFALLI